MPRRSQASSSRFMKRARPTSNSTRDRKSTRLNSSHSQISYAVFCLKKKMRELLAFEIANGGQVSIVNRLDRETRGLVLFAKTSAAARRFGLLIHERRLHKEYLAIFL